MYRPFSQTYCQRGLDLASTGLLTRPCSLHGFGLAVDGHKGLGQFRAEEVGDPLAEGFDAGQVVDGLGVVRDLEGDARVDQGDPGDLFGDVADLGRGGLHELAAGGRIEEKVADLDRRAGSAAAGGRLRGDSAFACDSSAGGGVAGSAGDGYLGDGCDAGEGLAAEAHCLDAIEVVFLLEFAGGVRCQGQRQVVELDAPAVIDDLDEAAAAVLDVHFDVSGAGIESVFEQFLDDAGGAFDDLAGGDLVLQVQRQ